MKSYEMNLENGFKAILRLKMPFDLRHTEDSKNYGVSGLLAWFILIKDNKAVQFLVGFNSYLSTVDRNKSSFIKDISAYDLGYHSPEPFYEFQSQQECDLLEGGKCYYDGSGLNADEFWEDIEKRSIGDKEYDMEDEIFKKLEEYWDETFGGPKE